MRDIITKKHKHLLYRDECGNDFLITKDCEIYAKSDSMLGVVAFANGQALKRILRGKFNDFSITDDQLYLFTIKVENLPYLLGYNSIPKRRMKRGSRKLIELEKTLGHKILNYRPKSKEI